MDNNSKIELSPKETTYSKVFYFVTIKCDYANTNQMRQARIIKNKYNVNFQLSAKEKIIC